ncbi:hypothetical protein, partial [Streptomyces sp. NPDC005167]
MRGSWSPRRERCHAAADVVDGIRLAGGLVGDDDAERALQGGDRTRLSMPRVSLRSGPAHILGEQGP